MNKKPLPPTLPLPSRRQLKWLGGIALLLLLLLFVAVAAFQLGRSNGLSLAQQAAATAEAMRQVFAATFTPTPSATATETPAPTFTPTLTSTPTATPASAAEWADRYYQLALQGLNTLAALDFTPERAAALAERLAHEQGLIFVAASYFPLATDPWAAFIAPRTPEGTTLPMLFWRSTAAGDQIVGQLLLEPSQSSAPAPFSAGIQAGTLAVDAQGISQIVLVERPEASARLKAALWAQPLPGAPFVQLWSSDSDPQWDFDAAESTVTLEASAEHPLPDLLVASPLNSTLQTPDGAAAIFIEQPPFARQQLRTRWQPATAAAAEPQAAPRLAGYRLAQAEVQPTPLSTLATLLAQLQRGEASRAQSLVARIDLLNELFDLGLALPGDWMAVYVNEIDREIQDGSRSERLRFFDNADRNRSYEATFALESTSDRYILQSIAPVLLASSAGLVTPAPPRPTATPTPLLPEKTVLANGDPLTLTLESDLTGEMALLNPTLEPTPTATPTFTPTPTDTPTATATPTETPQPTATPTWTPSPTETPTPTPTEKPLPIPAIAPDAQPPVTGYMLLSETARLRGGPGTAYIVIAGLENGVPVAIFGITEAGDWLLIRAATVTDGRTEVLGWVATQLVIPYDDLSKVPRYRADGTSLEGPSAAEQERASTALLATLPTATPLPTPLVTPVLRLPAVAEPAYGTAPPPAEDEQLVTFSGEAIPPDPALPLAATAADGTPLQLDVREAVVEIWGPLLGSPDSEWVPANSSLLWPGTRAYLATAAATDSRAGTAQPATRLRIAAAPQAERVRELALPAVAAENTTAIALLGSRSEAGLYLLERSGRAQQLWQYETGAAWLSSDPNAGFLITEPPAAGGLNTFSWLRNDGSGLQIVAQPYFTLRGVAGDAYGGLWWIETPNAALDLWQLWHYDPATAQISLRLQADGTLLGQASSQQNGSLIPNLLAVQLVTPGDPSRSDLFVDTSDSTLQQPFAGVFRMRLERGEEGAGILSEGPQQLLEMGSYRGPLALSPDRTRLAFLAYNPDHPSLTAGVVQPPNTVNLLTLAGRGASVIRTAYATESRFEFLAPRLAWQENDRIHLARSRFVLGSSSEQDWFGLVQLQLPPPGASPADPIAANSYLLPRQQSLLDFAACQNQPALLVLTRDPDGSQQLAYWTGEEQIFPLFGVPAALDRAFLCWQP